MSTQTDSKDLKVTTTQESTPRTKETKVQTENEGLIEKFQILSCKIKILKFDWMKRYPFFIIIS